MRSGTLVSYTVLMRASISLHYCLCWSAYNFSYATGGGDKIFDSNKRKEEKRIKDETVGIFAEIQRWYL